MTSSFLEARSLRVTRNGRAIVNDVSLRLARGHMLGLVGPNGAGKSTVLRALAGLAAPAEGEIVLDGQSLLSIPLSDRARTISYLAQERVIGWNIPVRSLVRLGRLPHGDRLTPIDDQAIAGSLQQTRIVHLADRPVDTLSGGERALALLARALAVQAPFLLADEPVAGLDIRHQLAIMNHLREQTREGVGVLIVLHDLTLAAQFCDHVLVLQEGRTAAAGAPTEALAPAVIERVFGVRAHSGMMDGQRFILPLAESGPT